MSDVRRSTPTLLHATCSLIGLAATPRGAIQVYNAAAADRGGSGIYRSRGRKGTRVCRYFSTPSLLGGVHFVCGNLNPFFASADCVTATEGSVFPRRVKPRTLPPHRSVRHQFCFGLFGWEPPVGMDPKRSNVHEQRRPVL